MSNTFCVQDIVPYLQSLEKGTMEALADQVSSSSSPNYFSVFGRNSARDRRSCEGSKTATWNPCGYNSMRAIYRGAKRTGNEAVLNFCARVGKEAARVWKPWIDRWGQPPGEDSRYAPCGSMDEGRGDTDADRHVNADSLFLILSDPDMRDRVSISLADVRQMADAHFAWLLRKAPGYLTRAREYLRYGFPGDSLVALVGLYDAIGQPEQAKKCCQAATWFLFHIFRDEWVTTEHGTNGNPWPLWNYGDLKSHAAFDTTVYAPPFEGVIETRSGPNFDDRDHKNPFNYGWRRFGSQPWYDGYLFDFLRRFWVMVTKRSPDGSEDLAARHAVMVFDRMFRWYHPERRVYAPLGDYAGPGAQDFVNCKLHGWTADGILRPDEKPMDIEGWVNLPDRAAYVRLCRTLDYHESDPHGYHEKTFKDPSGKLHLRDHKGRVGIKWNSPDEDYVPSFESLGNNWLIPDATMTWGVMMSQSRIRDYALCQAFDYLHAANSSDMLITKGKRLNALAPPANQMNFARPWNWAVACGDFIREVELGTGE